MKGLKVWKCKIVVSADTALPDGFDSTPRRAAIEAVENAGIEVLECFSGWGGTLAILERSVFESDLFESDLSIASRGTKSPRKEG